MLHNNLLLSMPNQPKREEIHVIEDVFHLTWRTHKASNNVFQTLSFRAHVPLVTCAPGSRGRATLCRRCCVVFSCLFSVKRWHEAPEPVSVSVLGVQRGENQEPALVTPSSNSAGRVPGCLFLFWLVHMTLKVEWKREQTDVLHVIFFLSRTCFQYFSPKRMKGDGRCVSQSFPSFTWLVRVMFFKGGNQPISRCPKKTLKPSQLGNNTTHLIQLEVTNIYPLLSAQFH